MCSNVAAQTPTGECFWCWHSHNLENSISILFFLIGWVIYKANFYNRLTEIDKSVPKICAVEESQKTIGSTRNYLLCLAKLILLDHITFVQGHKRNISPEQGGGSVVLCWGERAMSHFPIFPCLIIAFSWYKFPFPPPKKKNVVSQKSEKKKEKKILNSSLWFFLLLFWISLLLFFNFPSFALFPSLFVLSHFKFPSEKQQCLLCHCIC